MNKLLLIGLVAISCLICVECGEEEFHQEWKEFMATSFCSQEASEEEKDKFIGCAELAPESVKGIMLEKTETSSLKEAALKMCEDEVLAQEVCDGVKESGVTMTDEEMNAMLECKNN